MKQSTSKRAIAAFAVPPHPPKPVTQALARFNRASEAWASMSGELDELLEEATSAKAAAITEAAEAYASGKPAPDVLQVEQEYAAKAATLRARILAANVSVDETGNALAEAISEHRGEWLDELERVAVEAAARYEKSIAEALAALAELKPARGAVQWLEEFDFGLAHGGRQPQFAGGRVRVTQKRPGPLRGEHDPRDLLQLAGSAVSPVEEPPEREPGGRPPLTFR